MQEFSFGRYKNTVFYSGSYIWSIHYNFDLHGLVGTSINLSNQPRFHTYSDSMFDDSRCRLSDINFT